MALGGWPLRIADSLDWFYRTIRLSGASPFRITDRQPLSSGPFGITDWLTDWFYRTIGPSAGGPFRTTGRLQDWFYRAIRLSAGGPKVSTDGENKGTFMEKQNKIEKSHLDIDTT